MPVLPLGPAPRWRVARPALSHSRSAHLRAAGPNPAERAAQPCGHKGAGDFGFDAGWGFQVEAIIVLACNGAYDRVVEIRFGLQHCRYLV